MSHYFYAGGTDTDIAQFQFKGGQTDNIYNRKSGYATASSPTNPFRFRFVAECSITDLPLIRKIEKEFLDAFKEIRAEESDDLNSISGVEWRQFQTLDDFKTAFLTSLKRLQLSGLLKETYTTNDEINALLKRCRDQLLPKTASKSFSGKTLRDYQDYDIKSTVYAFKEEGLYRGFWAIECGLGKTLMAYEYIRRMNERRNIFIVPRNALLVQALKNFKEWGFPVASLAYCSSETLPSELSDIPRTSSYNALPTDCTFILVVSYDSLSKFEDGRFDVAVFDEAHHLVPSGKKNGFTGNLFGLDDANIHITYRLAITGTPKDTPLIEDDETTYKGMSHQPEVYGPCLASRNYTFGLENGYLSPCEVICIKTDGASLRRNISRLRTQFRLNKTAFVSFCEELELWEKGRSRYLVDFVNKETDELGLSDDMVLWYALVALSLMDAIKRYRVSRIITYHTSIEHARHFALICHFFLKNLPGKATCECVCSTNGNGVNQETLDRFRAPASQGGADIRLLTNCRTLVEGFDAPSVDCTIFVDNKWSPIECKQILGRGNRKDETNPGKTHRILIPFIAYEKEEKDLLTIRSSNDYKTVRYVVKHILFSKDGILPIQQTVWVPRERAEPSEKEDEDSDEEDDPSERVWVDEDFRILHDETLAASFPTADLAGESFQKARLWMHQLARTLAWVEKCKVEVHISSEWKRYKETHQLPAGIPNDPSKVYREVGWVNWRDYCGVLSDLREWSELKAGELSGLVSESDDLRTITSMTQTQLADFVAKRYTRRLPASPRTKWRLSIYDIIEQVDRVAVEGLRTLRIKLVYDILRENKIRNAGDYEQFLPELRKKHTLPGMPTELWGETFWGRYEDTL